MISFRRLFLCALISFLTLPSPLLEAQACDVKCTDSLAKTFLSLRRVSMRSFYDGERLIRENPNFNVQALYPFLTVSHQHVTFIFETGRSDPDQAQWRESKRKLSTMMSNLDRKAVFVIGSAVKNSAGSRDRAIALARIKTVTNTLKSALGVDPDTFFYTFTGEEGFPFNYRIMQKLKMITKSSTRLLKRMGWAKRDAHVNQNVMILVFHCIPEMCKAAEEDWGKTKVCDNDPANEFHLKECVPFICGRGEVGSSSSPLYDGLGDINRRPAMEE